MNKRMFFVHIPKTAGTSFRKSAEKYFGLNNTYYDYGVKSVETSSLVLDCMYKQEDLFCFYNKINNLDQIFLSGHVAVAKYMSIFNTVDVVTFMRNPIEQVVSHYTHWKTHNGYKKSLKEFIQEKRFSNVQFNMLSGKPLELFGFVGLTEEYKDSLEIINFYFNTDIKYLETNQSEKSKSLKVTLDDETINLIKKHNEKDFELYKKAKKLFYEHRKAYKSDKKFIYRFIQSDDTIFERGVAFHRDSTMIAEVEFKNGKERVKAKSLRPGLMVHNLPRNSCVGYEYRKELN